MNRPHQDPATGGFCVQWILCSIKTSVRRHVDVIISVVKHWEFTSCKPCVPISAEI